MPCGAVNQHTLRELFLALSGLILFNPFRTLSGDAHRGFCNPLHVLKKCGIFDQINSREDGARDGEETVWLLLFSKVISVSRIAKQNLVFPIVAAFCLFTNSTSCDGSGAALKHGL